MIRRTICILIFGSAGLVQAENNGCIVCDTEIVMTPALAQCFLDQTASTLNEMKQRNLPFSLINLGTCDVVDGGVRGDGNPGLPNISDSARELFSWGEIRNSTPTTPTEPTTTFILDEWGVRCLDAKLRDSSVALKPAAAFRLYEMCDR